jgi:hypothetical protein
MQEDSEIITERESEYHIEVMSAAKAMADDEVMSEAVWRSEGGASSTPRHGRPPRGHGVGNMATLPIAALLWRNPSWQGRRQP